MKDVIIQKKNKVKHNAVVYKGHFKQDKVPLYAKLINYFVYADKKYY